jgi:hypothetical protein
MSIQGSVTHYDWDCLLYIAGIDDVRISACLHLFGVAQSYHIGQWEDGDCMRYPPFHDAWILLWH